MPHAGEHVEKIFIRIAHPQAGLGREPIELAQPFDGRLEAFILQNLRLVRAAFAFGFDVPFVAGPFPKAAVDVALGLQPQLEAVAVHFQNEQRLGGVRFAQIIPVDALAHVGAAQFGDEARAEFVDRRARIAHPFAEERCRRAVAQEIKGVIHQHHRGAAGEKLGFLQGHLAAIGQQ